MSKFKLDLYPRGYQEPTYVPGNWNDIFNQMTANLSTDAAIINQATAYLSSIEANAINNVLRESGIQQLQTQMKLVQYEFTGLKSLFSTSLSSGDFFSTSYDILDRADKIIGTLDRLDVYANSIINSIDTGINFVSSLPDKIEDTFNNFSKTLEKLADFDLSNAMDKLPDLVAKGLKNLDIVQDPLILLNNIQVTVVSIAATISSIKAPQNLNDVRALLSTLRAIIAQIRGLLQQAEDIKNKIQKLAHFLQSGNYISFVLALAKGGVTFFQRPPAYNARYPYNGGYRTHGGHIIERDNTPHSERVKYQHPTNTSVEVQPDGGIVVKGENDFQLSVSKNLDVLVKNAATITVKGTARLIANNVQVEASGNATITSSGSTMVNSSGNVSVTAVGSAVVSSGGTATVSSVGGTSISATGLLSLSSNTGINITSEGPINVVSSALTETVGGPVVRTNATCIETSGGPHQITGAPINLN